MRILGAGCLKGVLKSVQVLLNGIEAVMVLTLTILKQRALYLTLLVQRARRWLPRWTSGNDQINATMESDADSDCKNVFRDRFATQSPRT